MTDEQLDKLGTYFVHFNIEQRYNISFEQFIQKVRNGIWKAYLAD